MSKDIGSRKDIETMVDEFYSAVRADELIGPIFNGKIGDRWPEHLSKMYSFWETVLLGNHTYSGAPFMPHATLPLTQLHFDRWLLLFDQTIDRHFAGPVAEEAKARAAKMAVMFMAKIDYLNQHKSFKNLF